MALLFDLVLYVLSALAFSKLAKKAGLDSIAWYAWVPIMNMILILRIIGESDWKILYLLIPIANIVFLVRWYIRLFHAFGKSGHWTWMMMFLSPVMYVILFVWANNPEVTYHPETI